MISSLPTNLICLSKRRLKVITLDFKNELERAEVEGTSNPAMMIDQEAGFGSNSMTQKTFNTPLKDHADLFAELTFTEEARQGASGKK